MPLAPGPPTALTCHLTSAPAAPLDYTQLPHYGASTVLSLPLNLPTSTSLLLASVLLESRVTRGSFRVIGGAGVGRTLVVPPSGNFSWASKELAGDASTLAPLASAMGALLTLPPPPPALSTTLSGASHLLLLLAAASAPFHTTSNVTLNGVPCVINWVASAGTLVSITTPPLSLLCGAAAAEGDCGVATLLLSEGVDPRATLLSQLSLGAPALTLPAAYPPLLPSADLANPATGALLGLNLPSLLIAAAAVSPPSSGLRLTAACTDISYAAFEDCALVGGAPPPPPPNGTVCAWGAGDACAACPAGSALCPGGTLLLSLPGWWAPLSTSPPGDLVACPEPDATLRCPGWAAAGAGGCGAGFRGQACSGCAAGFFPSAGTCAACPRLSAFLAQALPLLQFVGGLLALGLLLLGAAQAALCRGGRKPPPCRSADGALAAVLALLSWTWAAAQSSAALFSQTLGAGLVPQALLPAFGALAALQFVGVTLAPACYTSIPFQGFWASLGVGSGALVGLLIAEGALRCAPAGARCVRATFGALLSLFAMVLTVGYGAFVNSAVTTLTCRLASPLAVADYVRAASDGRALGEALGASAPPLALLRAAADDPFLAQRESLTALLRAAIPVSTLASDPFVVCREGTHTAAWYAGAVFLAVLVTSVPGLGLCALWRAGRLKGLRRLLRRGQPPPLTAPTPPPPSPLIEAFVDPSLRAPAAWFTFFQLALTALCSGVVALSLRAASVAQFAGLQALLILSTLGAAGLVWRVRPHLPRERWRTPVLIALYVLSAMSAAVNLAVRFAGTAAARGLLGWGFAVALLVAAGAAFSLLFWGWWWALVARARAFTTETAAVGQPEKAVHGEQGDGDGNGDGPAGDPVEFVVENPLRSVGRLPPAPRRWHRVLQADGAVAFFHAGSGESCEWDVPPGDEEDDAGVWQRVRGAGGAPAFHWRCAATGATAATDADLPLGALTDDCAWQWEGRHWRAVARTKGPWLSKEGSLSKEGGGGAWWFREREGGVFVWRCGATGAVAAGDGDLPTGASTAGGWALHRDDGGDAWWYHEGRGEALWEGPWVAEEAGLAVEEAGRASPAALAAAPGSTRPDGAEAAGRATPATAAAASGSAPPHGASLPPAATAGAAPEGAAAALSEERAPGPGVPAAAAGAPEAAGGPAREGWGSGPVPELAAAAPQSQDEEGLAALLSSVEKLRRVVDAAAVSGAEAQARGTQGPAPPPGAGAAQRGAKKGKEGAAPLAAGGKGGAASVAPEEPAGKEHGEGPSPARLRALWATSSHSLRS